MWAGAVIGRNMMVAARSVVRGEILDHCVVAGVIREHTAVGWHPPQR